MDLLSKLTRGELRVFVLVEKAGNVGIWKTKGGDILDQKSIYSRLKDHKKKLEEKLANN